MAGWLDEDRQALLARLREAHVPGTDRIPRISRNGPLPLSLAQARLWFVDRLSPASALYNVAGGLWLRGPLDHEALRRAVVEIVDRHEVLRTLFRVDPDGELIGMPAPPGFELPVIDVEAGSSEAGSSEAGSEAASAAALWVAQRLAARPLDLANGPLMRATLLRVGDERHLIVLVAHHAVVDRWSLEILVRELATCYGAPATLPDLPVQYADYAAWQRERLESEAVGRQLEYWRRHLRGARPLETPTDRAWPDHPTFAGATREHHIPQGPSTRLMACARRHRATPLMAALAIWAVVFSRLSGQTDVVLGTPAGGRDRAELVPVVGCFVNMLPIRLDLAGRPTFGTLLDQVRRVVVAARANAEAPFETVVQKLRLPRDTGGRVPLLRHVVQYADPVRPIRVGALEMRSQAVDANAARFDLTVFVTAVETGSLACRVVYSTELYDAARVDRILAEVDLVCESAG